ncbi:MAG: hypothetical protein C0508_31325, partial [Cyanobacteria bacterium PR.023]|nr:hypothetical protein [Cyanobacteria bacterium PR.023]
MASENLYVSLESFRCFAKAERIRIAPVTILVGENSTGKTSFLAALRRIFESFSYPQANAFNREPYFLGSFEQISHYRGGKAGRAKTFCLEIEIEPASGQPDLFSEKKRKRPESLKYKVKFSKGRSQPAVSGFEIVFANIFASFEMANSKVIINVKKDGIDLIQSLNVDVSDTLVLMDPIYISYFLNDFARRARTGHDIDDEQAKVMEQISSAFSKASRQMRKRMFASAPV